MYTVAIVIIAILVVAINCLARSEDRRGTMTGPLPLELLPHYHHRYSRRRHNVSRVRRRQRDGAKTGLLHTGLVPHYPHHYFRRRRRRHNYPITCTGHNLMERTKTGSPPWGYIPPTTFRLISPKSSVFLALSRIMTSCRYLPESAGR